MTDMAVDNPYGRGGRIGADDLRREEVGWTLGERLKPGMLIQEGPETCPYLVERVTASKCHGLPCWNMSGWYAPDGVAERNEARRWWLNEWVAVRYSAAPLGFLIRPIGVYSYDCPARDFVFIVAGEGVMQNRAGQLGLML